MSSVEVIVNERIRKVCGHDRNWTYSEEDEEALVFLSNTVVDPGTVVVHLADAALTDTVEEEE